MSYDCGFQKGNNWFRYRAAAIIVEDGCILFAGNITDYRVVQELDFGITVYADIDEAMKEKVRGEFIKLSEDHKFIMPEMRFEKYFYDKTRKLKRVERIVG